MFLNFSKLSKFFLCFFVFGVVLFAHRIWLFDSTILTSGDWNFLHPEQVYDWRPFPQLWQVINGGSVNIFFANSLIELPYRFLTSSYSFGLATRVLYFIPIVFLSIISILLLTKQLGFSYIARLVAVSIYIGSTPLIITRTGHNTLAMAYAIAPLLIYSFNKLEEEQLSFQMFLIPIISMVMCAYEPRGYYLVIFFLFCLYIFGLFKTLLRSDLVFVIKYTFRVVVAMLLSALTFSYWILPLYFSGSASNNGILSRSFFGSSYASFLNSFSLHHAFWNGGKYVPFEVQPIPIWFFVSTGLFIISLLVARNKVRLFPYFLLTIVGLFLSKQENSPLGHIYEYLYSQLPGFNAFREGSKFYFYITLGYAITIGGLFDYLLTNHVHGLFRHKIFQYMSWAICILTLIIFSSNLKPLATGEIGTLFVPRSMPNDYEVLNSFLRKSDGNYRILSVPIVSRWIIRTDPKPLISFFDVSANAEKLYRIDYKDGARPADQMARFIEDISFQKYLDDNSVRFVVVPTRDTQNDDDFFESFGNDRNVFVHAFAKTKLGQVSLATHELLLYENPSYKQRVSLVGSKNGDSQTLHSIFINATDYELELRDIKEPVEVIFNETFHPGWKIFSKKDSEYPGFDILSAKFLASEHTRTIDQHNKYFFDLPKLCRSGQLHCVKTNQGYSARVSLLFEPQRYVFVGGVISLIILSICACGGVIIYLRHKVSGHTSKKQNIF